jgi:pimeloyl-ACP methyl ester carboxylesterase
MLRRQLTLALLITIALARMATGQAIETGFLNRIVSVDGKEHRYQVFVPREYKSSVPWPVVLALHGGGERGNDGSMQTDVGLGRAIRRHADRFPAIVVFPQSPAGDTPGWQSLGARVALTALDSTMAAFNTDASRVYLTGLSMGGNGSWYLAYHHADRFAAAVIVCGWVGLDAPAPAQPPIRPSRLKPARISLQPSRNVLDGCRSGSFMAMPIQSCLSKSPEAWPTRFAVLARMFSTPSFPVSVTTRGIPRTSAPISSIGCSSNAGNSVGPSNNRSQPTAAGAIMSRRG